MSAGKQILILSAFSLIGSLCANANVTGITNGSFESQTLSSGNEVLNVTDWYESSTTDYSDWVFKSDSAFGTLDQTVILGFSRSESGYVYQQIGTYTGGETVNVTGQVLQRAASGSTNNGFRLELLSGDFASAADGTALAATILDTKDFDRTMLTSAPYNFGVASGSTAYAANFSATLSSGLSGTNGSQLWLRISGLGKPGEVFLDNLAASAVPEPSTYGLAGTGALVGAVFLRRRRR